MAPPSHGRIIAGSTPVVSTKILGVYSPSLAMGFAGTEVTLSLGTSSTVYSFSSQPVLDPTGNVAPFCSSSGGWLPLVCTMNVTAVTERMGKPRRASLDPTG